MRPDIYIHVYKKRPVREPPPYLTNRRQFSMVYTLIDHNMTSKNAQNSSGFTAKFWTFLWRHFMIYKSIDHKKCRQFVFCNNMEKVRAELAIFSLRKRMRYI